MLSWGSGRGGGCLCLGGFSAGVKGLSWRMGSRGWCKVFG